LGARVKAYDPIAMKACHELHPGLKIRYCQSVKELALDADALVVVTEWNDFRNLPLAELAEMMASPVLVDGRNIFSPETAMAAGFDYAGIGRSPRSLVETRESRRTAVRSGS
jgi:UDPglucose 6-dehydrogenase